MRLKEAYKLNAIVPPLYSVDHFGAKGDSTTDDAAAIQKAFDAGGTVYFQGGKTYYVGSTLALTAAHNHLIIFAHGATILKGFNGDLFTLTSAPNVGFEGGLFDGNYGSHTGRCFVLTGASYYPKWSNLRTFGFSDSDWHFGADSGKYASLIACEGTVDTGESQTTADRIIHVEGPDTGAMFRSFSNCQFTGGVDLDGALDTEFATTSVAKIETDGDTSIMTFMGGLIGNAGGALSIDGDNIVLCGMRISAAVTIESGSSGSFIGNIFTSGGLTDSSTPGDWFIAYKAAAALDYTFGKNLLYINETVASRICSSRVVSPGDNDITFSPGSSASVFRFATVLTADRTVTLSTTGATNGTRLRVVRAATATGAYTIDVGGVHTLTLANGWCDVEYNGSAYVLTSHGPFNRRYLGPNSVTVQTGGTPVGSVSDMQTFADGNEYNLPETNSNPGYDLEIDFVGVSRIDGLVLCSRYVGSTSHYAGVYLYNYNTTTDDFLFSMDTRSALQAGNNEYRTIHIADDTDYIDGSGNAQISIIHNAVNGNLSHDLYIDYIALIE